MVSVRINRPMSNHHVGFFGFDEGFHFSIACLIDFGLQVFRIVCCGICPHFLCQLQAVNVAGKTVGNDVSPTGFQRLNGELTHVAGTADHSHIAGTDVDALVEALAEGLVKLARIKR